MCRGQGCEACDGTGQTKWEQPLYALVHDMRGILQLFRFADHGHLPKAGGVLDQTASFLRAYDVWKIATASMKNSNG